MWLIRSKIAFFILFILAGLFAAGFLRSYFKDYGVRQEIKALEDKQLALERYRSELLNLLKSVQSKAYAEEQAREQFGLRKPGEKSVVIQQPSKGEVLSNTLENESLISNPILWWLWFFGPSAKD